MLAYGTTQVSLPKAHPALAICDGLDAPSQERLFCMTETQDVSAKQTIFCEGDSCNHLFEVIEGVVGLYKLTPDGRRQIIGFAYPGQLLGTGFHPTHAYTAEAISDARLCRYPRAKLEMILEEMPGLGNRLLAMTASALSAAHDQMLLLGRKTAIEKVASFVLRLSEMNERNGGDPETVFLPMMRGDIADFLGLAVETVSRVITQLRTMGVIDLHHNNHVRLRDMDRLRDLAEGDEPAFTI
jgi:CRP/FNR family transcriptional regulator